MGTQYNGNPNGASSAGWSLLNVTASYTGDGVRLKKAATGLGGATQTVSVAGSGRLTLAGVQVMRHGADPLPEFIIFGRNSGVQEYVVEAADAWAPVGQWVTLPLVSTPGSTSGAATISINSTNKYDVTVRRLYVYAYGDADAASKAPDLDAGDGAWSVTVPNNALTATAKWNATNDEWVDTLEWKASSGSTPYQLPASQTTSHTETWSYVSAGTVTASLTVRNYTGDLFLVQKVFSVPSGVFQADFDYEADYLHVEVDGSDSVGAVIQRWSWNWGDSSSTNDQTVPYASHTYASPGSYYVQLTITNSMGQSSTLGQTVTVASVPTTPIDFTVALDKLAATVTSLTTGTTYGWTFGDGGTASTPQATHTYATAGTYTVVLTVDGVSISQSVTVSEDYTPLSIVDSLRLEIKQDPGDVVPWNRLPNPSGALGASGWTTPSTEFSGISAGPQGFRIAQAAGESLSVYVESVWIPVLPGRYITGSFRLVAVDAPCYVRGIALVYDAAGNEVAATTITAYQNTPGTYWTGPVKVPSSGRYASLDLYLYGSAGPTFPAVGKSFTWREAQIASSLYQSEVTNPPYSEAGVWADVLGPTHEISISRGELDVSTLTATILDAELDPVVADTIRPGAEVRLRVATERDGLRVWEPIYSGKADKATATYGRSNLEELTLATTELVINPTMTSTMATYDKLAAGVAMTATAAGGRFTLTGFSTANTYQWGVFLKIPVVAGRAYRVKLRARRDSGGYWGGLVFQVRAFNSLDVDAGSDIGYDVVAGSSAGLDYTTQAFLTPSAVNTWVDDEYYIRPEYLTEYVATDGIPVTMNLWFNPRGDGTSSPNGVYTITDVSVVEEWTPPALPKLRKSTRITLEAWDAASPLAQTTQPVGVATLQEIPSLMEPTGVPVTVDGEGNTGPDPQVATMNDNASLLDQIVAARDTQAGYAHVSRAGVLTLQTAQGVSTLPATTLDESAYADADVTFSTADVINSVVVTWQRWDPTAGDAGELVETIYGPYEDLESIREWGLRRESFTWVGQVENVSAINAQAAALLAANSTPQRRVHQATIPIRYATDLSPARALLDLMDLVHVKHARTGLDQLLRLTAVKHTITARNGRTPAKWVMAVGFTMDGTVARPIAIPSAPPGGGGGGIPFGHATSAVTQSVPNATSTTLTLGTDVAPPAGGVTRSGGVFTVPRAGVYLVSARCRYLAHATGARQLALYKAPTGGTLVQVVDPGSSVGDVSASVTIPVVCAAGDTLEMRVYQSAGVSLNVRHENAGTGLSVVFLGT